MKDYNLLGNRFEIRDYTNKPAFSSFLPGIAGVLGTPIWAFYCNRGQGINSFGINHKGDAMMEFNPANTAYENTPIKGFRTFVSYNGRFFEPFFAYNPSVERRMEIENNVLTIFETGHGLEIKVSYIILPNENIGSLVRKVSFKNSTQDAADIKLYDGMAQIIPFGVANGMYKEMSNLFRSWADIKNIENRAPLFTMRSSSDDSAEMKTIEGGYFYTSIMNGENLHIVYDKKLIFGENDSMTVPQGLLENGFSETAAKEQCFANKIPCAFAYVEKTIGAGEEIEFTSFAGFAPSIMHLNRKVSDFKNFGYTDRKFDEARALTGHFTKDCRTKTGSPLFDKYIEQCYLDNFLRGGYPFVFGKGDDKAVVHLFSRKHGDPERDYNWFSTAGEFYSQGNGNYRDVCQNRRHDVFFNPAIGDFNIYQFYSMIQADGYNPLEIRPSTFAIKENYREMAENLVKEVAGKGAEHILKVLGGAFTPGQITNAIAANGVDIAIRKDDLVEDIIAMSEQNLEAGFGEGYWCDHWDYNLDLLEDYMRIFPDKLEKTIFEEEKYRFYQSAVAVRHFDETCVLSKGNVRCYGATYEVPEIKQLAGFNQNGTNWLKNEDGSYVVTTLFGKLLTLAMTKFTLLDPEQMGIYMDGGKPGWNDAMNGLPGLFGSSMPETIELKRTIETILTLIKNKKGKVSLPEEQYELLYEINGLIDSKKGDFGYWTEQTRIREEYRDRTRVSLNGVKKTVTFAVVRDILEKELAVLDKGIDKAMLTGRGIMPTYFTYEAREYSPMKNEDGSEKLAPYGLPQVKVLGFRRNDLPRFLEGPARLLAASGPKDLARNKKMFTSIKESDIYDNALMMYKTSESIEEMSIENGRVRAFTAGWLERESIFLHMEYKYFLGLMKAGLHDEFYASISKALVPFQDPQVYKRSILENSSFIASSANPDKSVHGQGFVARLTGSTVEMLSMWIRMFMGDGGFGVKDGQLTLRFAPVLSKEMFDENNEACFTLCKNTTVLYRNPKGQNTYGEKGVKVCKITVNNGRIMEFSGDTITGEFAEAVRNGKECNIIAELE